MISASVADTALNSVRMALRYCRMASTSAACAAARKSTHAAVTRGAPMLLLQPAEAEWISRLRQHTQVGRDSHHAGTHP